MDRKAPPVTPGASHLTASIWGLAGFAATVICGLGTNVVIENQFGKSALGLFSVCLSMLVIGGQLGTMGQHNSTLFFVSTSTTNGHEVSTVMGQGLRIVVKSAGVVAISVAAIALVAPAGVLSDDYRLGILCTSGALALYPINKVLIAGLNGLHQYRRTSIANGMRFFFMFLWTVLISGFAGNYRMVPIVLSLAELSLLLAIVAMSPRLIGDVLGKFGFEHTEVLFEMRGFGRRSFLASLFLDINTRVDILVLSVLRGAEAVGKYTMASALSEGLYQMCMATRLAVEPRIGSLYAERRWVELRRLVGRHASFVYLFAVPVTVLAMVCYSQVAAFLYGSGDSRGTTVVFVVLTSGIAMAAGFIPLTNLRQQMGDPAGQSCLLVGLGLANLALNLVLVPIAGVLGSAIGTAVAQVLLVPMLLKELAKNVRKDEGHA